MSIESVICERKAARVLHMPLSSYDQNMHNLPSCAAKSSEIYLKQLHSYHSEHELQEVGNQHDIADRLNGYYHAFHYILAIGRFGMKG